ncbi:MAG: DUF2283 domain-containing protein [Candidatus Omnitrophota bacterium]
METIKIKEKNNALTWEYDEGADVLYISLGEPRPALGTDIGEGLIVRYDEKEREIVGLTVIGLRARTLQQLESYPA